MTVPKKIYGHRVSVRMTEEMRGAIREAIEKIGSPEIKTPSAFIKAAVMAELKKQEIEI